MNTKSSKKKKSPFKKIIYTVLILFVILIGLLIILPYFFKDEIKEQVLLNINKKVNAKVEIEDVGLSLIKSFPNFNANIENISVVGVADFDSVTLFSAKEIELVLDFMSVIRTSKPIEIVNFTVDKPNLNVITTKSGKANYDIMKSDGKEANSEEPISFGELKIESYAIKDGTLSYRDEQTDKNILLKELNHKGKGQFENVVFNLDTDTDIKELTFVSDNIPLVNKAHLNVDIDFEVNAEEMSFKILKNSIVLNELNLQTSGNFKFKEEDIEMDVKFGAVDNDFKDLFSIIPSAYIEDYKDVKANGKFNFDGFVAGKFNAEKEIYPNFNIKVNADNGYVKYPSLPLPIEKIFAKVEVSKKSGGLDNTVVDIGKFNFTIDGDETKMNLKVTKPISDATIKGYIDGLLNLKSLSKAFPIQDVKQMEGIVSAKSNFHFNTSQTITELDGSANVKNLNVKYADFPVVKINSASSKFSNAQISVKDVDMMLGKSDVKGNVIITEPFNVLSKSKPVAVLLTFSSQFFDADEWMSGEKEQVQQQKQEVPQEPESNDFILNKVILGVNGKMKKIKYEDYDISNMQLVGKYEKDALTFDKINMDFFGSNINLSGNLKNIMSWVLENKTMKGDLLVSSPNFDLDKYMNSGKSETTTAATNTKATNEEPFVIPKTFDIKVRTDIKKAAFTGKNLENLTGNIVVKDQNLALDNFSASGMGGRMLLNGLVKTSETEKTDYQFDYKIDKMKYEKVYESVMTVKALAPIAKFFNGLFDANFKISGKLEKDLSPDLGSISASGLLYTINAYIKNYPALNSLSSKLQIGSLDNFKIENSKNYFEIKDGTVVIKPFKVEYDDMTFDMSGTNKLDKTIDYNIVAKIPKEKIGKIPGSKEISKGLDFITSKAKNLGLNVSDVDVINMNFKLNGKFDDPKVNISVLGTEGKSVKKSVEDKVDNLVKDTKKDLQEKADKEKKKVEKKAKEEIESAKNKAKKELEKQKEKAKKELEKEADKAKDKLNDAINDFNPFKKKKK